MELKCSLCPRKCRALRTEQISGGMCQSTLLPTVARAAAHFGEEPCIAGERGTGAVFFTGCNLKCVFCQNRDISRGQGGMVLNVQQLRDTILRLRDSGVDSIDLVTGTHFIPAIAEALSGLELGIPVVWNSSGYESIEGLKMLEGLVQVYMPDFKYWDKALAGKYSKAEDYPEVAAAAIKEMYRQVGAYELDERGIMQRGMLIRHLILPGEKFNSMDVIDFVADEFPEDSVLFSLMSQYTPPAEGLEDYPELQQTLEADTNSRLIRYMQKRGLSGYWQELSSATEEMLPEWDLSGLQEH
ncbi:MAG: radical SAM protein [Oscillospiraceae bacterium]|nr:radical SAM protein [Oscillospiraceae bacterium]